MEIKKEEKLALVGKLTIKEVSDGRVMQEIVDHNKVVNGGLNIIIKGLVSSSNSTDITHVGIGTGTTAVQATDTQLQNQTFKSPISSSSEKNSTTGSFSFIISDSSLTNQTYTEVGLFVGNTLFSRLILTTSYTKSAGSDTLITYEVSVSG